MNPAQNKRALHAANVMMTEKLHVLDVTRLKRSESVDAIIKAQYQHNTCLASYFNN